MEPVLLVPPLMVTAQVYDISPPLSSVALLANQGMDVWLCDFGSPETEEDGLKRTLDDHLMAIDAAIEHIAQATGKAVHVAGYSQGGLFVYRLWPTESAGMLLLSLHLVLRLIFKEIYLETLTGI